MIFVCSENVACDIQFRDLNAKTVPLSPELRSLLIEFLSGTVQFGCQRVVVSYLCLESAYFLFAVEQISCSVLVPSAGDSTECIDDFAVFGDYPESSDIFLGESDSSFHVFCDDHSAEQIINDFSVSFVASDHFGSNTYISCSRAYAFIYPYPVSPYRLYRKECSSAEACLFEPFDRIFRRSIIIADNVLESIAESSLNGRL